MSSTKTTDTTQNQSSTSTTAPDAPQFLTQPWQDFAGNLQSLNSSDPYQTVGPTSDLTAAFNGAQSFQPSSYLNQAASLVSGGVPTMAAAQVGPVAQASAVTASPYVSSYLNPATQAVAGTTLTELNQANQLALNSVDQGAELAGGYGGSRQGIAQGLTNSQFQQNAASALSNLNLQDYNNAVTAAQSDANRAEDTNLANTAADNQANLAQAGYDQQANANNQQATFNTGSLLGSLGATSGSQTLQNLGLLGTLGQTQYGIAQNQANDPYLNAQMYTGLLNSVPSNLFVGSTTNANGTMTNDQTQTSSDPLQEALSVAGLLAAPLTGGASASLGGLLGLGSASAGLGGLFGSGAATGIGTLGDMGPSGLF